MVQPAAVSSWSFSAPMPGGWVGIVGVVYPMTVRGGGRVMTVSARLVGLDTQGWAMFEVHGRVAEEVAHMLADLPPPRKLGSSNEA